MVIRIRWINLCVSTNVHNYITLKQLAEHFRSETLCEVHRFYREGSKIIILPSYINTVLFYGCWFVQTTREAYEWMRGKWWMKWKIRKNSVCTQFRGLVCWYADLPTFQKRRRFKPAHSSVNSRRLLNGDNVSSLFHF